ncbi:MAG: hypothetical protein H6850_01990 [Alphaproteobacteria bacterium]|nr:MAG: hypothetical protein H6850_01990 [Alphaproteobacteria bacterium]
MSFFLIKQEHGLALLKQAVLSQAPDMQIDILGIELIGDFNMDNLCALLENPAAPLQHFDLKDGDTVIFELPLYVFDHVLWTGIVQYKKAIDNKLQQLSGNTNDSINVIPMACPSSSLQNC